MGSSGSGSDSGMTRTNIVSSKRNASDSGGDDDGGTEATQPPSSPPPLALDEIIPSSTEASSSHPDPVDAVASNLKSHTSDGVSNPLYEVPLSVISRGMVAGLSATIEEDESVMFYDGGDSDAGMTRMNIVSSKRKASSESGGNDYGGPMATQPLSSPPPLASDEFIPLSTEGPSSHPDPDVVVVSNPESRISDGVSDPLYDVPLSVISHGMEAGLSSIIEEDETGMFDDDGGHSDAGMTRKNIVSKKLIASSDSGSDDDGGPMETQQLSSPPSLVPFEFIPLSMEASTSHSDPVDVIVSNIEEGILDSVSDPLYDVPLSVISRGMEAGLSAIIEEDESVMFFDEGDFIDIDLVGDKEPLSSLAAQFYSGSTIFKEKIKLLQEKYEWIRRTKGDGNCFFRCFMFSYLEHILETQDLAEIDRVNANIEQSRGILEMLGDPVFSFSKYFAIYINLLEGIRHGTLSQEELLRRSRCPYISDKLVIFHRIVASGEIRVRADFYEPFIVGLEGSSVEKFCKSSVEPMGEESDHVQIIALSDALNVPIRVEYLDQSLSDSGVPKLNHHDFQPSKSSSTTNADLPPKIILLYRPGHYDILYPKLDQHANANASYLEV